MSDENKNESTPEFIPLLPRTKSDDLTQRMYTIDHRLVKMEGAPDLPLPPFVEEEDTVVTEVEWNGALLCE